MSSLYALDDPGPNAPARPLPTRASVGDEVYDLLLSQLISLRIAPGARIPIDKVARDLGVSQTPVRAALIRLESEGLVVKTHLVGYSAASLPSARRLVEIYQIRLLLEPFAARMLAASISPDTLATIESLHREMQHSDSDNAMLAYGKFAQWDARFHQHIAQAGGGELLAETLGKLHTHVHLFRILFHSRVTEEAIHEHEALLQALRNRDPDAAAQAMERHIRFSFKRISPILQTLADSDSETYILR